ncbi:MAG: ABC transporter permease [Gordonia sp. (in: high G+C Gram-positive bacteria)]
MSTGAATPGTVAPGTVAPGTATPGAVPDQVRPHPVGQWWTLTARGVSGLVRSGEIIFAFISPAFLAICFYLPLRTIMDQYPGMDYAQYLMPIIALQSVGFVASSAAVRSSLDRTKGINTRFRSLPMPAVVPPLARLSANVTLLVISLICATVASLVIGWRPQGGVVGTIALYTVALVVGSLIALIADAIGTVAAGPESTSQILGLPILILGMLSTGVVPAERFPDWIAPFVRNQPISQFADAMRAFNDGTATAGVVLPTLWWCLGLGAVAAVLLVPAQRRLGR